MRLYRGKFGRLLELDDRIRAGKYPNAFSFANEWEVSRRTIMRDIEYLRDCLRAPIAYDAKKRGYYYTDPLYSIEQVELTEGELLLLLVAERMAQQYHGTPLAETLDGLFEKLQSLLPDAVSVDPLFMKERISFHGTPAKPISEEVWMPILRALRDRRALRIEYKAPSWQEPRTREVEPVHLACIADEWYLVAHDRGAEDLRHFSVARVQPTPEVLDEVFEPQAFDPGSYFENRFGRFVGKPGETHEVAIRFDVDTAPWILEREWHPKQKVRKHRDGALTLSFPAPSLYEVKRWVLQWGAGAEVVKPLELRRDVAQEIEALTKAYRA